MANRKMDERKMDSSVLVSEEEDCRRTTNRVSRISLSKDGLLVCTMHRGLHALDIVGADGALRREVFVPTRACGKEPVRTGVTAWSVARRRWVCSERVISRGGIM